MQIECVLLCRGFSVAAQTRGPGFAVALRQAAGLDHAQVVSRRETPVARSASVKLAPLRTAFARSSKNLVAAVAIQDLRNCQRTIDG